MKESLIPSFLFGILYYFGNEADKSLEADRQLCKPQTQKNHNRPTLLIQVKKADADAITVNFVYSMGVQ